MTQKEKIFAYENFFATLYEARNILLDEKRVIALLKNAAILGSALRSNESLTEKEYLDNLKYQIERLTEIKLENS